MDWFLSGNGLCHERVKKKTFFKIIQNVWENSKNFKKIVLHNYNYDRCYNI